MRRWQPHAQAGALFYCHLGDFRAKTREFRKKGTEDYLIKRFYLEIIS